MNLAPDMLPDSLFQSVPLPLSSPPRDSLHFFLPRSPVPSYLANHSQDDDITVKSITILMVPGDRARLPAGWFRYFAKEFEI